MTDQAENDPALVTVITAVVREADREFEHAGGSSRHWVRDCFLPLLNRRGLIVMNDPATEHAPATERKP